IVKEKFSAGKAIISENTCGDALYILTKGEISIEKELIPIIEGYEANPDDKKIIRVRDEDNFYFGEMSLFDPDLKRTASVLAVTDVEVAKIKDRDFELIINERNDIGVIILKNIGLKLSRMLEKSNIELSKMITAFTLSLKL
ncbi:MAG: cyclic nucleotide-binding domain-containing protein, partial [Candidatus Delongbacteria bacterium]